MFQRDDSRILRTKNKTVRVLSQYFVCYSQFSYEPIKKLNHLKYFRKTIHNRRQQIKQTQCNVLH